MKKTETLAAVLFTFFSMASFAEEPTAGPEEPAALEDAPGPGDLVPLRKPSTAEEPVILEAPTTPKEAAVLEETPGPDDLPPPGKASLEKEPSTAEEPVILEAPTALKEAAVLEVTPGPDDLIPLGKATPEKEPSTAEEPVILEEPAASEEVPSSDGLAPLEEPLSEKRPSPLKDPSPRKKSAGPGEPAVQENKSTLRGPARKTFPRRTAAVKIQAGVQQISLVNDDTLDDRTQGVEIQLQSWPMKDVGFALTLGHADWDLNIRPDVQDIEIPVISTDEQGVAQESTATGKSNIISEGDLTAVSVGFSAMSDIPVTRGLSIQPNMGLKYVFIEVDAKAVKTEGFNPASITSTADGGYDADNAILGVIGVDARLTLTKLLSVLVGVGYQFDIIPAEITASFGDDTGVTQEIELDAFYGQAAVALTF